MITTIAILLGVIVVQQLRIRQYQIYTWELEKQATILKKLNDYLQKAVSNYGKSAN